MSICFVAGLLFVPTISFAKDKREPVVLEPSTHWSLDYAEEKCRLARAFGEGDDRHMLFFEQTGPSSGFGMTAAGVSFDRFRDSAKIGVQFGSASDPVKTMPFRGSLGSLESALIYSRMRLGKRGDAEGDDGASGEEGGKLPHVDTDRGAEVEFVSFSQRNRQVIFNTGSLEEPMAALNQCGQAFLTYWGLDLDRHLSATRLPVWINEEKISERISRDYPARGRRAGEQAVFRMRVIVTEQGGVEECHLANATITESLDSSACKVMQQAMFEPALDAQGAPMKSYYVLTLSYRFR